MKREFISIGTIPAFRAKLSDFRKFIGELERQFPAKREVQINVYLSNQSSVSFTDLEEFFEGSALPEVIRGIEISIGDPSDGRGLGITLGATLAARSGFIVGGPDYVWPNGVGQFIREFFSEHRRWYSFFRTGRGTLLIPLIIGVLVGFTLSVSGIERPRSTALVVTGLLGLLMPLARYQRLFPLAVIVVRGNESFLRRWLPEVSTAIALASLAAAIATLLR